MILNKRNLTILSLVGMFAITSCDDGKKQAELDKVKIEAEAQATAMKLEAEAAAEKEEMRKEAEANSIAAKAMGTESLSTLVAALKAADLATMMMEPGSYTVFAPSNSAFAALPKGTVENLLKPENKEALTKVLQYHVVKGKITADELAKAIETGKGKYTFGTVTGGELTAMRDGDQFIIKDSRGKKAQVVLGNVDASNGVVHVIDNVLMEKK